MEAESRASGWYKVQMFDTPRSELAAYDAESGECFVKGDNERIQVLEHEPDRKLVCFYLDYEINLSRDFAGQISFGNWYMDVRSEEGEIVCDGWIDDSSGLSLCGAFEAVCAGAELELPTFWPELN